MGVLRVDAEREKPDTKSTYGTVSFVKGQKQAKLVMREIRVTPAWGMGWWGLDLGSGCAGLETQTNPLPTIQRLFAAHLLCAGHRAGNTAANPDFVLMELRSDRSLGTAPNFMRSTLCMYRNYAFPQNMLGAIITEKVD